MTSYLKDMMAKGAITQREYQALLPTGVQSAEELYALTLHFPSLADALPDGNLARISSISAQRVSKAFMNSAVARLRAPVQFSSGVTPPPNAKFPIGSSAVSTVHRSFSAIPRAALQKIDHHTVPRKHGWPIRDQGKRGTCVAHALAACKELQFFHSSPSIPLPDESEQFLFWGAKQFDQSNTDGTRHEYALKSLQFHGLCDEAAWPYNPSPLATFHQGPPPGAAISAASSKLHVGGSVTAPANASQLYTALGAAPVSIGVPVFVDTTQPTHDNWNVGGLMEYGRVLDPPPKSVVIGGHAVCVVGFEPDPNELSGHGWFIIRNSWDPAVWGSKLPSTGTYWGPAPGYGQISWSYVDSYLWEMCSV